MEKWCHNSKTGEIFSYNIDGELTDFPKGTLMAYGDYLTTGISSKEKAEEWAKEWGCCNTCKSTKKPNKNGNCNFCGDTIVFNIGG